MGTAVFIAIAAACFAVVGVALRTGRILGIAFRSRFIARREHEPVLFWLSVTMAGVLGLFLAYIVVAVQLL